MGMQKTNCGVRFHHIYTNPLTPYMRSHHVGMIHYYTSKMMLYYTGIACISKLHNQSTQIYSTIFSSSWQ